MKSIKRRSRILSTMMAVLMFCTIFAGKPVLAKTTTQPDNVKRNVMYYADWSIWGGQGNFLPSQLPVDAYTHLNFSFLDFDANGDLVLIDKDAAVGHPLGQPGVTWGDVNAGIITSLRTLRAENPNMKIGVSVGGWSRSGDFTHMANNPVSRANFISNIVKFLEYTTMDFVDIDWEYPADVRQPDLVDLAKDEGTPHAIPADKENYTKLLKEMRTALDAAGTKNGKKYELSVALPIDKRKIKKGIEIKELFEVVDFANMMTYDARGAFDDVTGHHSPLYGNPADPSYEFGFSIDQVVNFLLGEGVNPNKIVIGAAFYSRGWGNVENTTQVDGYPGLFSKAGISGKDADQTPSRGALNDLPATMGDGGRLGGVWAFRNQTALRARYQNLVEYWDEVAQAPYLFNGTAFFTYDNERSLKKKAEYVNENNLGGIISWMASNDAPSSPSSPNRDKLTNVIKTNLFGPAGPKEHNIPNSDMDIKVDVKPYSGDWGGKGYEITIKNNEVLKESNETLSLVENQKKSIMLPKLYIDNSGIGLASGNETSGTVTTEGNLTVVDMSSVYTNKILKPGTSVTFKLKYTGSQEVDVDNLKSIKLTQRTYAGATQLCEQIVYKNGEVAKLPVISGAADVSIELGEEFDPMKGVTAKDVDGGDLTSAIVVSGEVDHETAGKYTLVYTVENKDALKATVKRIVTVLDEEETSTEEPSTEEPSTEEPSTEEPSTEEPSTEEPPSGEYIKWSEAYQSANGYPKNTVVTHKGKIYKQVSNGTIWYGEPGTNASIWLEIGTDPDYVEGDPLEWNLQDQAKGIYTPGTKVIYKGIVYEQVSSTTAYWCEPGTNSSIWKPITNS